MLTTSEHHLFLDWANSIKRKRPSVVELREIYEKADLDFTASRLSGIHLVNPYQEGTNGYFFWEERIKDLKIFFPSTNMKKFNRKIDFSFNMCHV